MTAWWRRYPAAPDTIDLVDDEAVSALLLLEPLEWRVRAVEHIRLDSSHSCERRRSIQCAPLRGFLVPRGVRIDDRTKFAWLAVNVAAVPRGPLMNLDLEGPLGDVFLLPRQVIAQRQVAFVQHLAAQAGLKCSFEASVLLRGMFGVPIGASVADYMKPGFDLKGYLEDGLGLSSVRHYLERWIDSSEACADILGSRTPSGVVATMNPVIAFPEALQYFETRSIESLDRALCDLRRFIESADRLARGHDAPNAASDLLNSVAEYSMEYELIVAVKVPLDEPFMLKYSERRDLRFNLYNEAAQNLILADANSNHVVLDVSDPSVEIRRVRATQVGSEAPTFGAFSSRDTHQAWSLYASDNDRDYKATLRFLGVPAWRFSAIPLTVAVLLVLLAIGLWRTAPRSLGELAVVAGPAALAASVLFARDPSTLGRYLRRWTDWTLAGALAVLLLTCVVLYWMSV